MKQRNLKYLIILSVLLLGPVILTGCKKERTAPEVPAEPGFEKISRSGITFQWRIEGDQLEVILSAPTEGWVAVAFNPTEMMQGANFVIGYIQDGQVYIRNDHGNWLTSHVSDESQGGTQDAVLVRGEEKNGSTTLRFTLPVDSSDEYDVKLNIGGTNTILLAYGAKDSFTSMHRLKTKVETEF